LTLEDFDPQSDWAQILSDLGFNSLQRGLLLKKIHGQQGSREAPSSGQSKQQGVNDR
jgi:hypothetical protein